MNLSVGIIGLPNAGKSTLFNALLKKQVAFAANYPFATIEPNIGVVPVPDVRLEKLAEVIRVSEKLDRLPPIVPATVKFVDIAGLVAGAHKGEGLGNKFLAHIREVDLICHVLRDFKDADVVHVSGAVNEKRDREIIETELIMADLATLAKQTEPRGVKDKEAQKRWDVIIRLKAELNSAKTAKDVLADEQDKKLINDLHLMTMKPVLYVLNVGEEDLSSIIPRGNEKTLVNARNAHSGEILRLTQDEDAVVISAKIEAELAGLAADEQKEYLKSLGLDKSGLERLIQKAYAKLNLISFLTGGEKEVRAWTIVRGTKAPQAAGVIHTDFEKGFIKAEAISFPDFVALGGWKNAREKGKVRFEGKDYEMKDGDVVDFKVST